MSLPKVCLIYTGGTIAMFRDGNVLKPPTDPGSFLRIAPEINQIAEIDFVPLLNKDSTNMTPADWTAIAAAASATLACRCEPEGHQSYFDATKAARVRLAARYFSQAYEGYFLLHYSLT